MAHIYPLSKAGLCNIEAICCPLSYTSIFKIMKKGLVRSGLVNLKGSDAKPQTGYKGIVDSRKSK